MPPSATGLVPVAPLSILHHWSPSMMWTPIKWKKTFYLKKPWMPSISRASTTSSSENKTWFCCVICKKLSVRGFQTSSSTRPHIATTTVTFTQGYWASQVDNKSTPSQQSTNSPPGHCISTASAAVSQDKINTCRCSLAVPTTEEGSIFAFYLLMQHLCWSKSTNEW